MISRDEIIAEARTWIGTPFKHQGRLKGVGVDCVGVIVGVAKSLNILDYNPTNYSRLPNMQVMGDALNKLLIEIDIKDAKIGDIYWMKFRESAQHLAFKTDIGILHATSQAKKCIETSLNDSLEKTIYKVYRFKGIE